MKHPHLRGLPNTAEMLLRQGAPLVPRVVVGYPCGASVTVPWAKSMMQLVNVHLGRPPQLRSLSRIIPSQGLYVGRNRNNITRQFLKDGNEEYLLQIDTDIEFKPEVLDRLLDATKGRDIVAGNIRLGAARHAAYRESGALYAPMETLPEGEIIPVDAAATAMMIIHRRVFEAIFEMGGPCWFNLMQIPLEIDGKPECEELGEDLAFCVRAKAAGFQTYLVRGLGLKHHKTSALEELDLPVRAFHELTGIAEVG